MAKKKAKKKGKKKASKKKASKKVSKKGSKKKGAKKAKKKGRRKKAKRAAAAPAAGEPGIRGPRPVSTGRGPSVFEVANSVTAMIRAGAPEARIWDRWFHPGFTSIEGNGLQWRGREAVAERVLAFHRDNTIAACEITGPLVGGSSFAVRYTSDIVHNATGARVTLDEIGVYTVEDGRVIREEFMYAH